MLLQISTVMWGKITDGDKVYLGYFPIITGVLNRDYSAVIVAPANFKWGETPATASHLIKGEHT